MATLTSKDSERRTKPVLEDAWMHQVTYFTNSNRQLGLLYVCEGWQVYRGLNKRSIDEE